VRGFTQDDAHLFVTPEQIEQEMRSNIELVLFVLSSLGLFDYRIRVGLRDPASHKYVGSDEDWNNAERVLLDIVSKLGMKYSAEQGEAAFYGPEDRLRGARLHRPRVATGDGAARLQPAEALRPGVHRQRQQAAPAVMIHRAPFGSMERFMGILIEHFAGAFPLWLAPEQVRVLTVSERFNDYARTVEAQVRDRGYRVSG